MSHKVGNHKQLERWRRFTTAKERGEWVEQYREAWGLLAKHRAELTRHYKSR